MTDLTPIMEAAVKGAALCREVQQQDLTSSEKSANDPVTVADYGTQAILCRTLMQHYPADAVISEEAGQQFMDLVTPENRARIVQLVARVLGEPVDEAALVGWLDHGKGRSSARTWLIDPVDGTKGFLNKRHYVIAVATLEGGEATGAVVAAPAYPQTPGGMLFFTRDDAAYAQPIDGGSPRLLRVSTAESVKSLRVVESVEKGHAGLARLARLRAIVGMDDANVDQADSQEKYARIAAGDAEVYMRLSRQGSTRPHSAWDHAPGAALVLKAGGRVTGLYGEPLDYSPGRDIANAGVIASNGPIHDRLIEGVAQLLAEEAAGSSAEDASAGAFGDATSDTP